MRHGTLLSFIPLLFSCAASMEHTVRQRAVEDLECKSDAIAIYPTRQEGGRRYDAQGCDKSTVYNTKCVLFFCKVTDGGQVTVNRGPEAPPQDPYTEAQWTEYTAAAEAKVKEGAARVETLRLAGTFPKSAPHELMVKGGTPPRSNATGVRSLKYARYVASRRGGASMSTKIGLRTRPWAGA